MLLLDTNIILEIALEQDNAQECVNLLEQYDKIDFFISDFSIHSIGVILDKRNNLEKFDKLIEDLRVPLCIDKYSTHSETFTYTYLT